MTDQHPITPPPELVEEWANASARTYRENGTYAQHEFALATQAARWGADQELEACCGFIGCTHSVTWSSKLRAARRPKPPSLAEEALVACERSAFGIPGDRDTIRRALERLKELEQGNG